MRVWVTRDEPSDGPLSTALRRRGLTSVTEPVFERHVVSETLESIAELGPGDWLILTSPYAIRAAGDAARGPRIAVVGEVSRKIAESLGLRVELVGDGDGDSLFVRLREIAKSGCVCYPRSSEAEPRQAWADVDLICPVLYETTMRAYDRSVVERVDVVAVASPSAVRGVGAIDLPFASIGPTTSHAIREIGCEAWVEAPDPSFGSFAAAIAGQVDDSRHQRA